MKGQYTILGEILLFAFGIAIANYVIFSFQGTHSKTSDVALMDNYNTLASVVSGAVVKASEQGNSSVRIAIPEKIAGRAYAVSLKGGNVIVFDTGAAHLNATQKLFNITQENCISSDAFCARGDVISASRYIEVFSDGKNIVLRRMRAV